MPGPPSRSSYGRVLVGLLLGAVVVRVALVLLEWPASNSDEGAMGLMATHIAEARRFPVYMDGQSYLGTLQAYAAALPFSVTGPSLAGLRLPMVVLHLLFLVALSVLGRRLYGPVVALVSVGLLALGSREMLGQQLIAQGAIPETLLGGTLLLLLAHRVLDPPDDDRARPVLLACWGAVAALGLWSSVLVAPFVVTSAALLLVSLRGPGRRPLRDVLAVGAGLLVGGTPSLVHDLAHPWHRSGAATVARMYVEGGTGLSGESPGLVAQLANTLTTSLAFASGGSALAHPLAPPAWPAGYSDGWVPPTDDVVSALWGVVLLLLWAAAVVAGVRRLRSSGAAPAVACTRLALLAAAGLTVAAFAVSPTPGVAPANNVRYLAGCVVATPALVAAILGLRTRLPRVGRVATPLALALAALTLGLGTAQAFTDAAAGPAEAPRRAVLAALERDGVRHVRSGYHDCNRLTFLSDERVVCAVVYADRSGDGFLPGFDRFSDYRAAVATDPLAAYVFRAGDPRNDVVAASACTWLARPPVAGYRIWVPAAPCADLQPDVAGPANE